MSSTQVTGAAAEETASRHLEKHGLRVIGRNFRIRGGEIDLICRDGNTVVFVEVRLRRRSDYGGAGASITAAKRAKIVMAARHWLARHPQYGAQPCRFDCVLFDGDHLEWLHDAFAAD